MHSKQLRQDAVDPAALHTLYIYVLIIQVKHQGTSWLFCNSLQQAVLYDDGTTSYLDLRFCDVVLAVAGEPPRHALHVVLHHFFLLVEVCD